MNRISNSDRFVSKAAKSPGLLIAGPDVIFIFEFISFEIIFASVVLPNPGGPYRSTWSRASPLFLAASIYTFIFSFTLSCPIYSLRVLGLNEFSNLSSLTSVSSGLIRRSSSNLYTSKF